MSSEISLSSSSSGCNELGPRSCAPKGVKEALEVPVLRRLGGGSRVSMSCESMLGRADRLGVADSSPSSSLEERDDRGESGGVSPIVGLNCELKLWRGETNPGRLDETIGSEV